MNMETLATSIIAFIIVFTVFMLLTIILYTSPPFRRGILTALFRPHTKDDADLPPQDKVLVLLVASLFSFMITIVAFKFFYYFLQLAIIFIVVIFLAHVLNIIWNRYRGGKHV